MIMNVYIKLQQVRNELRKKDLKKTGKNSFSKYEYYELGDFLPTITSLCEKYKLCTIINFDSDESASLLVIDSEKPESLVSFISPTAAANLKGCHDVQNLGAMQTYLRRYLYMNAFEIVEHDMIDEGEAGKGEKKPESKTEEKRNYKKDLGELLVEMYGKENASIELEKLTAWTNKEGKEIKGKNDLKKLSDKEAQVNYGKLKIIKEKAGK